MFDEGARVFDFYDAFDALDLSKWNPHNYTVADLSTKDVFWFDEALYQSHTYAPEQPPPTSFDLRLWVRSSGADPAVSFDWIRLRQAVDPSPMANAGQPEMYR